MNPKVRVEIEDGIAWITLDDGKVNALSSEMLGEIDVALDAAESAGAVSVLSGREGIFSAGFDLGDVQARPRCERADAARGGAGHPAPARLSASRAHGLRRPRVPGGGVLDAVGRRALRRRGPLADRDERGRHRTHGPVVRDRAGAPPPDAARFRAHHDGGHVRPAGGAALRLPRPGPRRRPARGRRAGRGARLRALDMPSFAATKARINERAIHAIRAAADEELRTP